MSLNLFLVAIEQDEAALLLSDPTAIDKLVETQKGIKMRLEITGRWEVLPKALDNLGFRSSQFIDEVLSNGCDYVESDLVFRQSEEFRSLDFAQVDSDIQRLAPSASDVDEQKTALRNLAHFYMGASAQSLSVLMFAM